MARPGQLESGDSAELVPPFPGRGFLVGSLSSVFPNHTCTFHPPSLFVLDKDK